MRKAIFLDKDGTLVRDIPYNVNPSLITLMPQAVEGLKKLQDDGYLLIVISNQPGIGLGYFTEEEFQTASIHLCRLLEEQGIELAAFYHCPHAGASCICRKPAPGLLHRAARDYDIDLSAAWMVGDILNDVEAGRRAGCQTILINNGGETEWRSGNLRNPDHCVRDLRQAAEIILSQKETYVATTRQF